VVDGVDGVDDGRVVDRKIQEGQRTKIQSMVVKESNWQKKVIGSCHKTRLANFLLSPLSSQYSDASFSSSLRPASADISPPLATAHRESSPLLVCFLHQNLV
jgi:hypothetical protein